MTTLSNEWLESGWISDSGTGNGSTVAFTTTQPIHSALGVFVSLDGLVRIYTTDYSVDLTTNTITFGTAPAKGQKINIKYMKRSS